MSWREAHSRLLPQESKMRPGVEVWCDGSECTAWVWFNLRDGEDSGEFRVRVIRKLAASGWALDHATGRETCPDCTPSAVAS